MPLFIETSKDIFSHGVSQHNKNSAYPMSFNGSEEKIWKAPYKKMRYNYLENWRQNR